MRCTMHSTSPKLPPASRSGLPTYLTTLRTRTLTCTLSDNRETDLYYYPKSPELKTQRSEVILRFLLRFYEGKRVVRMECGYGYGRLAIKYQDSLTSVQKFRYAAQTGLVQVFLDFTQRARYLLDQPLRTGCWLCTCLLILGDARPVWRVDITRHPPSLSIANII